MSAWWWLAALPLTASAAAVRIGYALHKTRPTPPEHPMSRICRHQLRFAPHMPQWLTCDTCHADFPHRHDCPGHNTPGCVLACMTPKTARDEIAALEAAFALPAHGDAR